MSEKVYGVRLTEEDREDLEYAHQRPARPGRSGAPLPGGRMTAIDVRKMSDWELLDSQSTAIDGQVEAASLQAAFCGRPLSAYRDELYRRLSVMREYCRLAEKILEQRS